jgi:flagellin
VALGDGFSKTATWSGDGNLITIRDNDGFEMQVEASATGTSTLRVFDAGYMTIQIGANEHQTLNMNFPEVSCLTLGLKTSDGVENINLCTQYGASNAITAMDEAIKAVSSARSTLGSYQNRLETTASSLTLSSQNITEAMSRISDTDMADEMTQYTQQDVLSQAATSMLAQANNRPQQIMALLQ